MTMTILERGRLTYYIKDEAVVVGIGAFQWTSYNVYSLQNRKPFYDFRRTLLKSKDGEYSTIIDLVMLAKRFKLIGVAGSKPNEDNYEDIVRR
jgi:hypothetical protein